MISVGLTVLLSAATSPGRGMLFPKCTKGFRYRWLGTGFAVAEMIKYTSNAFLATKISFANEIGNICKVLGIDVYEVMKGVGLDQRIGQQFLNAGAGFGGSCFPKDVSSLAVLAGRAGIDPKILRAVLEVNEYQPYRLVALLEKKAGTLSGKRIAVLGLAFKDNTDDVRDSRAIPVIQELLKKEPGLLHSIQWRDRT